MERSAKRFHPLYLLSIFYVIAIYLFPVVWYLLNNKPAEEIEAEGTRDLRMVLPLLIPAALGLVNLTAVLLARGSVTREELLHCGILIKYSLIPFFIVGGGCIALTWLLTFSPVVIMIFVGPVVAAVFSVLGYLSMLGAAPFSIAYLVRSKREGVHAPVLLIAGGIMQFVFVLDTVSLMLLALKEKKCIKATVVMASLLVLAALVLIGVLVVKIVSAVSKAAAP